jgi:hypothetical protein
MPRRMSVNFISKKLSNFKLLAPAFAVALAALPGCGYDEVDYCDDRCNCEGCNNVEYDDCIDDNEDEARRADTEGCGDRYADWMDCLGEEFACRGGDIDTDGCGYERGLLDKCL